jgi:hypothetical protein
MNFSVSFGVNFPKQPWDAGSVGGLAPGPGNRRIGTKDCDGLMFGNLHT